MGRHGKKRASIPVRTGLLGVSAAMAVGAVAVTSGLLPGGDTFEIRGSSSADQVRSGGAPDLLTQGGTTASPTDRASASTGTSRSSERPAAPSTSPSSKSAEPTKPAATPSKTAQKSKPPTKAPAKKTPPKTSAAPAPKTPSAPKTSSPPPAPQPAAPKPSNPDTGVTESARASVLALVNQERAKVGCSPLAASRGLTALAQDFSEDMAARGFFSHTDPDGATPWDRAEKAGVLGLGGENIARGQADAQAVMDGWMNSDGHRANILNCDYKTLGVGVHLGSGGPWWTQDFGF